MEADLRGRFHRGTVPVISKPLVNGVPQRRRSPMGGGPIHVNVDVHGSYRAAWSGNWLGRSLGTNVRYRRGSKLAGRNAGGGCAGLQSEVVGGEPPVYPGKQRGPGQKRTLD